MVLNLIFSILLIFCTQAEAIDSITGRHGGYLDICDKASKDDYFLNHFRSWGEYRCILEIDDGDTFAEYIRHTSSIRKEGIKDFSLLDTVGSPFVKHYEGLGLFSATTLRYIFHADQIIKRLKLPENPTVVEIGAGFGGQCFILQKMTPCSKYYIYDLPEVESLVDRVMQALDISNVQCMPITLTVPEEKIDLVISNYAFSECDREMQMIYFENLIKKADRGYLIYNQIALTDYAIDSVSLSEFVKLLKDNGKKPKVYKELFAGAGNSLVVWSK